MRFRFHVIALLVLLGSGASPAQAEQPSLQQQFDSATSLLDAHKPAEALAVLEAMEARTPRPAGKNLTFIRLRKGEALYELNRLDEAATSTRLALEDLPADIAALKGERFSALLRLAEIDELKLDYGAAVKSYHEVASQAPDTEQRINALAGAIRTNMFFDADQALKDADTALSIIDPQAKNAKALRGPIRTLRARTLLNLGRFNDARTELVAATKELGGLTLRVNISDMAARSDNAIAAYLAGQEDQAREYLAYTGAGRLEHEFTGGAEMTPPPCGGAEGLRPDDVAVVEFSILDDGSVSRVTPIYSSRQGGSALAFAQYVASWSWKPEQVKNIPPFFRAQTRVELRCSNALPRPRIPDVFAGDVASWLSSKQIPELAISGEGDAKLAKPLLDELARREVQFGSTAPALLPPLTALADNAVIPVDDRRKYVEQALTIARAAGAPGEVIAAFALRAPTSIARDKKFDVQPWLDDPVVRASSRALAAFRLFEAEDLYFHKRTEEAIVQLQIIRDLPQLQKEDALRAAALIRLASLRLAKGDVPGAETSFQDSGLSAEQCALVDMGPRLKALPASSDDYPREVLQWQIGGWTRVENDIQASGRTTNVRVVVAYPPLVFDKAATQIIARGKFEVSFRPKGDLACGGKSTPVQFRTGY
jgi:hypothetical protein